MAVSVATNERFWAKVDKSRTCWTWTASRFPEGYGRFSFGGRMKLAHRIAYELLVGPIPDGLEIDHTCHNADLSCPGGPNCPHRACVRPSHLEPVKHEINVRRGRNFWATKRHCPSGHKYSEENIYTWHGWRQCRICVRAAGARYRATRMLSS